MTPGFRSLHGPVLICALLWGSAFPAIKTVYGHWEAQGLERTVPVVLLFAGIRFAVAGAGLLCAARGLKEEMARTSWKRLAFLALTQTFVQYVFFYQAVALSSASLTALLVATGSFWWVLLAPVFTDEPKPGAGQWLALVIGGMGVTLAVYEPGAGVGQPVLGAILMMLATGSGALGVISFRAIKPTMSARNATGLSLLAGGLALCVCGCGALPELEGMFDLRVIVLTVWLAFVSAAAFSLWNYLSTQHPVGVLASYRFLIPVCGVLEALVLLPGESAGWGLVVGGGLVLTSLVMANRTGRPRKEKRPAA